MHRQASLNTQVVSQKFFNIGVHILKRWAHDKLSIAIALLQLVETTQNRLALGRGENSLGHEHTCMGPVDPQVKGHQGLVRGALRGYIPAGHEGHHFWRGTYQAGAIEPAWRLIKLLTLEAIERVIVARRSVAHPAVALFRRGLLPGHQRRQTWKRTAPGPRWL